MRLHSGFGEHGPMGSSRRRNVTERHLGPISAEGSAGKTSQIVETSHSKSKSYPSGRLRRRCRTRSVCPSVMGTGKLGARTSSFKTDLPILGYVDKYRPTSQIIRRVGRLGD
jgi:hypothetical protein